MEWTTTTGMLSTKLSDVSEEQTDLLLEYVGSLDFGELNLKNRVKNTTTLCKTPK